MARKGKSRDVQFNQEISLNPVKAEGEKSTIAILGAMTGSALR